jgi:hypothetical protein
MWFVGMGDRIEEIFRISGGGDVGEYRDAKLHSQIHEADNLQSKFPHQYEVAAHFAWLAILGAGSATDSLWPANFPLKRQQFTNKIPRNCPMTLVSRDFTRLYNSQFRWEYPPPTQSCRTAKGPLTSCSRWSVDSTFALKIFRMLMFTADHPEFQQGIGVFWCPDGRHFWVEKDIVAEFCALRLNAVNTNLRDVGFRIQPNWPPQPAPEHLHTAKWRCRYHALITKATSEHTVAQIKIASRVDIRSDTAVQSLSKP